MGILRDVSSDKARLAKIAGQETGYCFFCGQGRTRGSYQNGFDITGKATLILICPFCIHKLGTLAAEAWASSIQANLVINLREPLSELETGFLKGMSYALQEELRQNTNNS